MKKLGSEVRTLIRKKRKPTIGLILSGGGTHGYAHIGVLKILYEKGIIPDFVVGSSVGALVGTFVAAGNSAEEIEKVFMDVNPFSLVDPAFGGGGLVRGEKIVRHVLDSVGVTRFDELTIPLIVNATNINTGKERVFKQGELAPALRSSIAFPGVFTPVKTGSDILVDGGVYNPLPVHLGPEADLIIAVDVSISLEEIKEESGSLDIMRQSVFLMQKRIVDYELRIPRNVIIIKPDVKGSSFFEFKKSSYKKLLQNGEKAAKQAIQDIEYALADTT